MVSRACFLKLRYTAIGLKFEVRVYEMAQQVKALVAEPDDLSSVPKTHIVEGKIDSWKLSSDPQACVVAHVHM